MAIADQSYFDWPELPEAPSDVKVSGASGKVYLTWTVHSAHPEFLLIERRVGYRGKRESVSKLPTKSSSFFDGRGNDAERVFYRVRATNGSGTSAYSNVASLQN